MKIDICLVFDQCGVPSGIFAANCHRQILSKKCKFFLEFKFDSIVSYLANLVTFCDSTILNESYVFLRQYICNLVITALSRVILVPPHSIFQQNIGGPVNGH